MNGREPGTVTFKGLDFVLLSDPQLLELQRAVELEIARRRAEGLRLVRDCRRIREGEGPRYWNPTNPAQTWSGRGARPSWVRELLARGSRLSDLRIHDDRPADPDFDTDPGF
jgi:hypothetical protein